MAQDPVCGMQVDESTGLKLTVDGKIYYFCSEHCLKKFAHEKGVNEQDVQACAACGSGGAVWYKNKVLAITTVLLLLVLLSYTVPFLEPFRHSFFMYGRTIWWAVVLGLVMGGIIDYMVPREYISKVLSKPEKKTIFYSVLLGFLMSVCSHGILAITIELYKKGASIPAVISFLLASPWANLPLTLMLVGFFGLKAFFIIISAIVIAIVTGLIYQVLEQKGLIEKSRHVVDVDDSFSIFADIKRRMHNYKPGPKQTMQDIKEIYAGTVSLSNMVLWWILLGMALASLTAAYIPQGILRQYMGPSMLGMLVTLLFATILEVCSEGTSPLAFEIYRQTGALGNSFVFLMAGVVTDYTEIGLLWSNIGRKTALWLPLVTVPQVLLLGFLANMLF